MAVAGVQLPKADLGLLSDLEGWRATIPALIAATPAVDFASTLVTFEGDRYPTALFGTSESDTWQIVGRYGPPDAVELQAALDLFRHAAQQPDPRLLLRTHYGLADGLDEAVPVVVQGYRPNPGRGRYVDLTFTAVRVEF